ncbi:MAG: hypothetical protein ACOYOK_00450 [Pseudobdellovibrionaceae bacterium]
MHKMTLTLLTLIFLSSCGVKEKDKDKIGDAQSCLDGATTSTAEACLDKVSGIESASAYNIRCAAKFIREGFADPQKIVTAFETLNNSSNQLDTFMSLITFTSKANITLDASNAETTFGYCYQSGAKGSLIIAAFGHLATALYGYLNSINPSGCSSTPSSTGYPLQTCLLNAGSLAAVVDLASANPSAGASSMQAVLGSIVLTTYRVSCPDGRPANESLCNTLKSSVDSGGSNSGSVGRYFLKSLAGI